MSTIASLLSLIDPTIRPYAQGAREVADAQRAQTLGQTSLLELADLKAKQAAEQEYLLSVKNDPRVREALFGGSILGSIGPAGGPPGAGPPPGAITQSPFGGGPAQQIPAYPDASRYANVSPQGGGPIPAGVMGQVMPTVTPPQSTLASLGTQPQGGMPGATNPALEMAARNPRAAMLMQGQMQQAQDRQTQLQEKALSNRIKVVDYLGRMAQVATDQDSWTQFREEADRINPGSGGRLPQVYSKEVRDRVVAQALDVKDAMTLQIEEGKTQAALRKTQVDALIQQQKMGEVEYKETPDGLVAVPKYPGIQGQTGTGVGGTPVTVGGQPVGSLQGQKRLDEKQQQTRQAEMSLQGEYNKLAKPYMEVRDAFGRIEAAGTSPTAAGDAALLTAYMKMLDPTTGVRNEEIRNAENVGGLPQRAMGWLEWLKGGAPLKEDVRKDFMDRATKLYAQYQKDYEQNATQYREQATRQGLDPRNVVQDYRSTTPGGGRTAFKPVGQMSRDELLAERDRLRKGGS